VSTPPRRIGRCDDHADARLFPALPLWAGVLVTAVDVLIVLAFFNSSKGRQGMMFFEILIVSLVSEGMVHMPGVSWQVLAVFVSFMVLLRLVRPDWGEVFYGFVPSKVSRVLEQSYSSSWTRL